MTEQPQTEEFGNPFPANLSLDARIVEDAIILARIKRCLELAEGGDTDAAIRVVIWLEVRFKLWRFEPPSDQ
jgi:hypothetical protein